MWETSQVKNILEGLPDYISFKIFEIMFMNCHNDNAYTSYIREFEEKLETLAKGLDT
jgi:hypothetical protein